MPTFVRNALAVVAGIIIGGVVNMALVMLGPLVVPPPPGADMTTVEGMTASMHLLEPRHFLVPFLAHAVGTLAGAFAAYRLAWSHARGIALAIGAFFLVGGVAASAMIPAPTWFIALDLIVAYLPMAWLGALIGARLSSK